MKQYVFVPVLLISILAACEKQSADTVVAVPKVEITSPVAGAKLDVKADNKVDYNVTLGGEGEHAHIYVDDRRIGILRKMQGSYSIDYLDPGKREICIKIVGGNHTPIGVGSCVTIVAE